MRNYAELLLRLGSFQPTYWYKGAYVGGRQMAWFLSKDS